jgi:hypothetical protein
MILADHYSAVSTVAGRHARSVAASMCGLAGVAYLVVVQQHLEHRLGSALFVLVAAIAQLTLARRLFAGGHRAVVVVAAVVLTALAGRYTVVLTAALPVGPHGEPAEAGWFDTAVLAAQLGALLVVLVCLGGRARRWAFNAAGALLWTARLAGAAG